MGQATVQSFTRIRLDGRAPAKITIAGNSTETIPAGATIYDHTFVYGRERPNAFSITLEDVSLEVGISISDNNGSALAIIHPGDTVTVSLGATPLTSTYTIRVATIPLSSIKWTFDTQELGGIECFIYVQKKDRYYIPYTNQRYVIAGRYSTPVFVPTSITPYSSAGSGSDLIGILIPGEFTLYHSTGKADLSSLTIFSNTQNPNRDSLAYDYTFEYRENPYVPFNPSVSNEDFKPLNIQARFYTVVRGAYEIRRSDSSQQTRTEKGISARESTASLQTVRGILDIIAQGNTVANKGSIQVQLV